MAPSPLRSLDYVDRPVVPATQDSNCILFDARLAHKEAANESDAATLKLAFTFINVDASKAQLTVLRRCLKRQSMKLPVADLLAGLSTRNELSGARKRRSGEIAHAP